MRLKLNQAARLMRRALEQSLFYQGTHLEVKGLVVRGMAVRAALKINVVKYRSISDAEVKDVGGEGRCDREVKRRQSALSKRQRGGLRSGE